MTPRILSTATRGTHNTCSVELASAEAAEKTAQRSQVACCTGSSRMTISCLRRVPSCSRYRVAAASSFLLGCSTMAASARRDHFGNQHQQLALQSLHIAGGVDDIRNLEKRAQIARHAAYPGGIGRHARASSVHGDEARYPSGCFRSAMTSSRRRRPGRSGRRIRCSRCESGRHARWVLRLTLVPLTEVPLWLSRSAISKTPSEPRGSSNAFATLQGRSPLPGWRHPCPSNSGPSFAAPTLFPSNSPKSPPVSRCSSLPPVVQFSRKSARSIVETAGPAAGNRSAPRGIRSATILLFAKPGGDSYVVANKGELPRRRHRVRVWPRACNR